MLSASLEPRKVWREGGAAALKSKGPVSRERLSVREWDRLEAELKRGRWPAASVMTSGGRWAGSRR